MQTIIKIQIHRFAIVFILVVPLVLFFLLEIGHASTFYQTIPTAPPTTAVIPTVTFTVTPANPPATAIVPTNSSTQTSTYPPQTTIINTQPTHVQPSQTVDSTANATMETVPSTIFTTTGLPGHGTVPIFTLTYTPREGTPISTTSSLLQTATVSPTTTQDYSGIINFLLGVGIFLIVVISIVWFIRKRR